MQEHALRIDIGDLEAQAFAQAQAAGVDGDEADAMFQGWHGSQNAADFRSRENDRQFELRIGAGQFQFVRPGALEGLFPEQFDRADGLSAGLTGDLLVGLEMDAVLANVFGGKKLGGFTVELTELTQASVIGLFGAGADGQELQVIGIRF